MLKWVANIVAVLTVVGLFGASAWFARRSAMDEQAVQETREAVRRFEQTVRLRASTSVDYDVSRRGYPAVIDRGWFEGKVPRNPLLGPENPWLEIAGPEQADLQNPAVRQAVDRSFAGLWYNPYQGIVRARVPVMISDEAAMAMYNAINSTAITSLFDEEPEQLIRKIAEMRERLRQTRAERAADPTQPLLGAAPDR